MSTIAFGDIVPVTSAERIMTMAVMVCGTSAYAYGITQVVQLVTGSDQTMIEFNSNRDELNRYMSHLHMPMHIRKALREYSSTSLVACCVFRVAAHRALRGPRYSPDRMCGFACHVYFE
mmetsp:Transcript_11525/g.28779  ORF Transcript_11525/g.28779 Transcript_11525/m.28779 type:complete len:119 (-) Transcript_11525:947-1303(-)